MRQERKPQYKIFIAITVLIIAAALYVLFAPGRNNSSGDTITITNYDAYVKNIPSSERNMIESTLYSTATLNNSDAEKLKSIKDAVIRKGTYTQTYKASIYSTSFIVDIKSIKQSYKIQDQYSHLSVEQSGLRDYTTLALCLDKDKLLYGDFKCQDIFSQQSGVSQSDPILQYLPVSTLTYSLDLDPSSSQLRIIATIHLSNIDYKLGEQQSVDQYKSDIKAWFDSKGLDITKYSISYKY
jgi:hypothetical protein